MSCGGRSSGTRSSANRRSCSQTHRNNAHQGRSRESRDIVRFTGVNKGVRKQGSAICKSCGAASTLNNNHSPKPASEAGAGRRRNVRSHRACTRSGKCGSTQRPSAWRLAHAELELRCIVGSFNDAMLCAANACVAISLFISGNADVFAALAHTDTTIDWCNGALE